MKATMLTAGTVISGSVVLEVVQRGEFVPQDLDICHIRKYGDSSGIPARTRLRRGDTGARCHKEPLS